MTDSPLPITTELDSPELPPTVAAAAAQTGDHGATMSSPQVETLTRERPGETAWPAELDVSGYEIVQELGRGGMGVVYKARQVGLGRLVALKMILSGAHAGPEQLARFQREAEAAACLQHANIVQVYEVGEHHGRPYFSLELVEGCNLAEHIDGTPQPPRQAAQLIETLARAVHYAHQRGIVHRDLKPANILLDGQGQPHVTDFGLAKRLDTAEGQTATGDILGTPYYMSPEQAAGRNKRIGPATDVYALGAILYELLTGRPPFEAESAWDVVLMVTTEEPIPPSRLQRKVPADLETICLKCLEKDPGRRYTSAEALAEDLRRFQGGEPIRARPIGPCQRLWKWARRRPAVAGLLGVVLLATAALFAGWVVYHLRLQQALQEAQQKSEESRQHLVRLHVANGTRLLDDNDWFGSLVWFTEALKLDAGQPERERMHRLRLASVLRQCPKLKHLWSHDGAINTVRFSPDGRLLVTASDDHSARVWDLHSGAALCPPLAHAGAVAAAEFSPDGRRLVTAGRDGARVWDAWTGKPLTPLLAQGEPLVCAAFSPDGNRVLTAGGGPTASLWDAATGQRLAVAFAHQDSTPAGPRIAWADFSPDGKLVVTAARNTALVWSAAGEKLAGPLQHQGPVVRALFSPDSRRLLTCSEDGTARVWDAASGKPVTPPLRHRGPVVRGSFSPDGKRVATASQDETARLWDAATGEQTVPVLRHTSQANEAIFSVDGRFVLTAGDDNTARVWDSTTGEAVAPVVNHNGSLHAVAFSPAGTLMVTTSWAGVVRVWDLAPERLLPDTSGEAAGAGVGQAEGGNGLRATSADGKRVLKVEQGRLARVYEAATGAAVSPPLAHTSSITHVAFSPDGRRVVTASDDNTARLWDADTGEMLTPPLRHRGTVFSAAFDPSGRLVATASAGNTARVWDADTGEPLTPPLRHPCAVRRASFSAAGDKVITVGEDSVAREWALHADERPVEELLRLAQLLSGNHINDRHSYVPLDMDEIRGLWRK